MLSNRKKNYCENAVNSNPIDLGLKNLISLSVITFALA